MSHKFTLHNDKMGQFCRVAIKEYTFLIDAEDLPILGPYTWGIWRNGDESNLYVVRHLREPKRLMLLHREVSRAPRGMTVDHIDGNGLNNRRHNLRICTIQQNRMNVHHRKKKSATGYRGVYQAENGKFFAIISLGNIRHYLGRFGNAEDAARAWDARAYAERGEYTQLNFPRNT